MSSVEEYSWIAYFSNPPPPKPSLTKIILDLKKRELVSPIFVCLQCTKETNTQQAMAAHCKLHVQSGMAKGTVEHIKYSPDHTYTFLCSSPILIPHASTSANPVLPQPPDEINQVSLGSYNTILPYAGLRFIAHLARSPFLKFNGPAQDLVRQNNVLPTCGNSQKCMQIDTSGPSLYPFGGNSCNGGCPDITPSGVTPNVDLTLRLGSTSSTSAHDTTTQESIFTLGDDCKGKRVIKGPWN